METGGVDFVLLEIKLRWPYTLTNIYIYKYHIIYIYISYIIYIFIMVTIAIPLFRYEDRVDVDALQAGEVLMVAQPIASAAANGPLLVAELRRKCPELRAGRGAENHSIFEEFGSKS